MRLSEITLSPIYNAEIEGKHLAGDYQRKRFWVWTALQLREGVWSL